MYVIKNLINYKMAKQGAEKKTITPASRDYTVNLHKRCHKIQFKKKAPRALREIRSFAIKNMHTEDVRIDPDVNCFIWNQGIRNIPRRIRVRLSRRKNEDDESGNKFYTEVKLLNVESFKGLLTEKSRDE